MEQGKKYLVSTGNNIEAICLIVQRPGRALFVVPHNTVTPFVSWAYSEVSADTIDCGGGSYYHTLEDALEGELMWSKE